MKNLEVLKESILGSNSIKIKRNKSMNESYRTELTKFQEYMETVIEEEEKATFKVTLSKGSYKLELLAESLSSADLEYTLKNNNEVISSGHCGDHYESVDFVEDYVKNGFIVVSMTKV